MEKILTQLRACGDIFPKLQEQAEKEWGTVHQILALSLNIGLLAFRQAIHFASRGVPKIAKDATALVVPELREQVEALPRVLEALLDLAAAKRGGDTDADRVIGSINQMAAMSNGYQRAVRLAIGALVAPEYKKRGLALDLVIEWEPMMGPALRAEAAGALLGSLSALPLIPPDGVSDGSWRRQLIVWLRAAVLFAGRDAVQRALRKRACEQPEAYWLLENLDS